MTAIWRPTELIIDPVTVPDIGFSRMRVTSGYGNRPNPLDGGKTTVFHDGLDIGNAREGDWVVAAAAGKVVATGPLKLPWSTPTTLYPTGNYGGNMVVIEHDGWCEVFAHLQPGILVKPGQTVSLGQRIASVGASGAASVGGAHLHYGHVMATAAKVNEIGAGVKPTRDPWIVIDPVGDKTLTWKQRIEAQLIAMRAAKPKAHRRWVDRTGLTYQDDGSILTRVMRQRAELAMLREAPEE